MKKLWVFTAALAMAAAVPALCAAQAAYWRPLGDWQNLKTAPQPTEGDQYQQICPEAHPFDACAVSPTSATVTYRFVTRLDQSGRDFTTTKGYNTGDSPTTFYYQLISDNPNPVYKASVSALYRGVFYLGIANQTTNNYVQAKGWVDVNFYAMQKDGTLQGIRSITLGNKNTPQVDIHANTGGNTIKSVDLDSENFPNFMKSGDVIGFTPHLTATGNVEPNGVGVDLSTTTAELGEQSIHNGLFIALAIPEPESYAMLLAGLGFLGCLIKARHIGRERAERPAAAI